jgi:hypothetical protein
LKERPAPAVCPHGYWTGKLVRCGSGKAIKYGRGNRIGSGGLGSTRSKGKETIRAGSTRLRTLCSCPGNR